MMKPARHVQCDERMAEVDYLDYQLRAIVILIVIDNLELRG